MSRSYSQILELVQNEAARVVVGAMKTTNIDRLHTELGWPSLATRRNFLGCVLFHKVTRGKCPEHLKDIAPAPINVNIRYNLRSGANQGNTYQIGNWNTQRAQNSFIPSFTEFFILLTPQLRSISSISTFKNMLRTFSLLPNPQSITLYSILWIKAIDSVSIKYVPPEFLPAQNQCIRQCCLYLRSCC